MKKLRTYLLAATALVPVLFIIAAAEKRESVEVSRTAQAPDFTQSIDVSGYGRFSAQAVYSDGTPTSTNSFTSGQQSTATFTVQRADVGTAKRASVQITISSYGTTGILTGAVVTLNGKTFTAGTDWAIGASSVAAAKNLSDAIEATAQYTATYTFAGASWAVVTASVTDTGTLANGLTASVSTAALSLNRSTFQGGEANGVIHIGTMTLTQGVDWTDSTTAALTAKAISNAILANMGSIIQSTFSTNVIQASSTVNGVYNYSVDGPSSFTVSGSGFVNGLASDINLASDTFTKLSHRYSTGLPLQFSTTSPNVAVGGLRNSVTYYAIVVDSDNFKLSDTSTGAVAGVKVDLTSLPLITASTYTFLPGMLTVAAGNGFYWTVSNDNVNFSTYTANSTSISSVTYSAAGNANWDFGLFNYRYLKLNFKGPSFGGITLNVKLYGTKD